MFSSVCVKRIYEPAAAEDGTRLLIDGMWPRGFPRSEFPNDTWRPDLAPSRELRGWYRHEADRFAEFQERYRAELDANPVAQGFLQSGTGRLTLLTATRDIHISHATVLRDYLAETRSGAEDA